MVLIMLAFVLVASAATVRLGQWQLVRGPALAAQFDAVIAASSVEEPVRADIVDRKGVVLARTSSFDQLVAHPDLIPPEDEQSLVSALGALLDLDARRRDEFLATIRDGRGGGRQYVPLAPRISLEESDKVADAIDAGALAGIGLEAQAIRRYPRAGGEPNTTLASQVLGYVRADGVGGSGLERYYDQALTTPDPSRVDVASVDALGLDLASLEPAPLQLTIDAQLQKQVEKELTIVLNADHAKSVSAIIMDPKNGAILAAASAPTYDAEDFAAIANDDMNKLRNRVFSDQYEPGSVLKIFTVTAALQLGVVTPDSPIKDQRVLEFYEYDVHNADKKAMPHLTVKKAIAYSRNVATAKIARKLGSSVQKAARRLYKLWDQVGLVGSTGVDISGEAEGNAHDPRVKPWAPVDLANRAFGQGSAFTLPQLARGASVLVNGGFLVQPHLVVDGEQAQVEPVRVLKAKVAHQAKDIMRYVTGGVPWYAKGALIPGYDIGGKTGTAQIWSTDIGNWKPGRWNHSFVGFIGGRKQEYVIALRIEEPVPSGTVRQGDIPLNVQSYQLYQMLARATIKSLEMRKSKDPEAGLPIRGSEAAWTLTPQRARVTKRSSDESSSRAAASDTGKKAKARKAKAGKGAKGPRADEAVKAAAAGSADTAAAGDG